LTDGLQGVDEGLETLQSMRYAKRYNRWIMSRISSSIGDRILEAGAGIGNITSQLLNRELVVAADNNSSYIARLDAAFANNPNVRTSILDLERPAELRRFAELELDTVICVNVVEHLENDAEVLRGFYDVLVPGGRAIVLVPNGRWLFGTIDTSIGHYRRYTRSGFQSRMEAAGFIVDEILGINRLAPPFWFLNGRVFKKTSVSNTQVKIFDLFVPLLKHVDRVLPLPPLSIVAVGRKP
jgi:SAM-dependent methyltransferase